MTRKRIRALSPTEIIAAVAGAARDLKLDQLEVGDAIPIMGVCMQLGAVIVAAKAAFQCGESEDVAYWMELAEREFVTVEKLMKLGRDAIAGAKAS